MGELGLKNWCVSEGEGGVVRGSGLETRAGISQCWHSLVWDPKERENPRHFRSL